MAIRLITLGKLKEAYFRDADAEYRKRLRPFAKLDIVELREEPFSEKNSGENIKKREAEKIQKHLSKNDFIAALDSHGKTCTSEEFAKYLSSWTSQHQTLTFLIGGPLGLDQTILKQANITLSLSSLTFTHQFARIVLLEQLYRAYMITANRKYHY
jgi:23S rRNA (pseudouridine1915-N3)-methyltransferase